MPKLDLNSNEVIILKSKNVAHEKKLAVNTDELVLTNQNIIHISKGILGNTKNIRKFPINQIKSYNEEPQVTMGKNRNGLPQLEIYFLNGHEYFSFQSLGKKEVMQWIRAIYKLKTGNEYTDSSWGAAIPGADFLANKIKDTVNTFRETLSVSSNGSPTSENVSKKCGSCSAPISGKIGQTIQCKYCDTAQTL